MNKTIKRKRTVRRKKGGSDFTCKKNIYNNREFNSENVLYCALKLLKDNDQNFLIHYRDKGGMFTPIVMDTKRRRGIKIISVDINKRIEYLESRGFDRKQLEEDYILDTGKIVNTWYNKLGELNRLIEEKLRQDLKVDWSSLPLNWEKQKYRRTDTNIPFNEDFKWITTYEAYPDELADSDQRLLLEYYNSMISDKSNFKEFRLEQNARKVDDFIREYNLWKNDKWKDPNSISGRFYKTRNSEYPNYLTLIHFFSRIYQHTIHFISLFYHLFHFRMSKFTFLFFFSIHKSLIIT